MKENTLNVVQEQEQPTEAGVDTPDSPLTLREPENRARPAKDSVDDQIDALLLRYETSSIRKEPTLKESLKNLDLRFLLEQEEAEDEIPAEVADEVEVDAAATDVEAPEPSGSEDMQVTKPAEAQATPDFDIDKFTARVVRLSMNYQNLLAVEEAVINRAKNFLDENYGEVFVNEFMNNLSSKYGLETQAFEVPETSNDVFAVGAFAGGTGGLGGGGS